MPGTRVGEELSPLPRVDGRILPPLGRGSKTYDPPMRSQHLDSLAVILDGQGPIPPVPSQLRFPSHSPPAHSALVLDRPHLSCSASSFAAAFPAHAQGNRSSLLPVPSANPVLDQLAIPSQPSYDSSTQVQGYGYSSHGYCGALNTGLSPLEGVSSSDDRVGKDRSSLSPVPSTISQYEQIVPPTQPPPRFVHNASRTSTSSPQQPSNHSSPLSPVPVRGYSHTPSTTRTTHGPSPSLTSPPQPTMQGP